MFYAWGHFKSCACIQQIVKFGVNAQDGSVHVYLNSLHFFERGYKMCYERKGIPEDQQFSDVPSITDANVIWRLLDVIRREGDSYPEVKPESKGGLQGQVPLDKCPQRCSERGTCVDGSCKCMVGFEGPSCESHVSNKEHSERFGCINHCGFRGNCENGFCHCEPGFWGIDCTRSKAYEAEPGNKMEEEGKAYSRNELKIYRYELPSSIAPFQHMEDWEWGSVSLYSAFVQFFELFANDTLVRVENPHEANLFYVPVFSFLNDDNAGDIHGFAHRALSYVNSTYPSLWGRNQGKDHFFWLPGDLGGCWLRDNPIVQNPIKVSHWGLEVNEGGSTVLDLA